MRTMTTTRKLPAPKTLERLCGPMAPRSGVEAAVDDYVKHIRPCMEREFKHWRGLTDEVAMERAGLALLPDGSAKQPHQYLIPPKTLQKSCKRLVANRPKLRAAESFQQLFELVEELIGPIWGIGEL